MFQSIPNKNDDDDHFLIHAVKMIIINFNRRPGDM